MSGKHKPKKSRAIIEDDDEDEEELKGKYEKEMKKITTTGSNSGQQKQKSKKTIDEDDEEDLEDDDDEEEEEEEEEEANPEEFNDFIDDNVENDDEAGENDDDADEQADEDLASGKKSKNKKKKKKDAKKSKKKKGQPSADGEQSNNASSNESSSSQEDDELEEDDLDLLKSNLNVEDLEEVGITQKRKRIQVLSDSSEEEERKDDRQTKKSSKEKSSKEKKKLKSASRSNEQAEDIEADEGEEQAEAEGEDEGEGGEGADEDEEGSFIVDDSDYEENKQAGGRYRGGDDDRARRDQKKKKAYTDEAHQEALDIFGVNAEELGALSSDDDDNDRDQDEEDEEEELDEEDELADEELGEDDEGGYEKAARKRQRQRRQLKKMHKIEDIFEPQELQKNLLTEFDQQIRIEDKPERFMLRTVPVTSEPDDFELEEEAKWIYNQAFINNSNISNQEPPPLKPHTAILRIKEALNFIRNEFFEVPFIASYRKENIQPELNIDDLWKIYEMDEKYCQLKTRKDNLVKLLKRMQKYQAEQLAELRAKLESDSQIDVSQLAEADQLAQQEQIELTTRLIEIIRPIEDSDIYRIRHVQTVDEFLDCYHHFHLHYGNDLQAMREYELKIKQNEKKLNKKSNKKKKNRKKKIIVDENGDEQEVDDDEADDDLNSDDENDDDDEQNDDFNEQEDETEEVDSKLTKYASKKDRFHYCKLAGLTSFAKKFGLTPEQLGENLDCDYQKHEIEQWSGAEPGLLAMDYVKEPYFQSADQVLSTVRYMIGIQMAREPKIRSYVRELYFQRAALCVRPTMPRGFKEIDESHTCYSVKYLHQKPCKELKQDDYLKLYQAEQDGLVKIRIELVSSAPGNTEADYDRPKATSRNDDEQWDDEPSAGSSAAAKATSNNKSSMIGSACAFRSINEKLKSFYQKDEFSYNVEQWNLERGKIIDEMLEKFLYPEFERELRSRLLAEAKEYVYRESAKKLKSILQTAPYDSGTIDEDDGGLRVLSVCFTTTETSEDNSEITNNAPGIETLENYAICACVGGDGHLEQFLTLKKLTVRLNRERGETLALLDADEENERPNVFLHPDKREKLQELRRIENFIADKRPNLIVVSAENKDALTIMDDMNDLVKRLTSRNQINTINIELIDNELGKLIAASKSCQGDFNVLSNTNTSALPALAKQAITLARFVQDPLLCVSQLFNIDRDILSLKLHAQQHNIVTMSGGRNSDDSTSLLRHLEIQFVNAANDVGVDLNRCNQQPHTSSVLQFVSGLGPRKAQHILKVLRHERLNLKAKLPLDKQLNTYPVVLNRLSLVTKCTLGRRVFINCAAFIKFDVDRIAKEIEEDDDDGGIDRNDEANYTEILDSTRIHPETYEWARKMAIDALDFDENTEGANSTSAVKEILENPKRLKDLDLDAFATELERTGHGNKITTLYDIRHELSSRYRERRLPFKSMDNEEKFFLLIKETPLTFYKNKLVTCKVVGIARRKPTKEQLEEANPVKDDNTCLWTCSFCKRNDFNELSRVWSHFDNGECPGPPVGIRVQLENGCSGFVSLKFLSDNPVTNPDDRIKMGMIIHARIKDLDPQRFRCELTSRTSDLRDVNNKWKPLKDTFFDYNAEEEDQRKLDEQKKKEEHKQTYTKRVIAHPQFKNVAYQQAVALLKDSEIGDAIIRPSSKGSDHLTVTWKVYDNCFQHVDVLEEKKMNAFSIGKRLIIDGEDFEDLDEILARCINPMAAYVREITTHKNFKDLSQIDEHYSTQAKNSSQDDHRAHRPPSANNPLNEKFEVVERFLLDEREKNPSKIPYIFVCYVQIPGKFMVAYMVRHKVRCEFITVTHEGFRFRSRMFRSFNELIAWFKLHYDDPIPIVNTTNTTSASQSTNVNNTQQMMSQMSSMSMSTSKIATPAHRPDDTSQRHNDFDSIAFGGANNRPKPAYNNHANLAGARTPYSPNRNNNDDDWDDGNDAGRNRPSFNANESFSNKNSNYRANNNNNMNKNNDQDWDDGNDAGRNRPPYNANDSFSNKNPNYRANNNNKSSMNTNNDEDWDEGGDAGRNRPPYNANDSFTNKNSNFRPNNNINKNNDEDWDDNENRNNNNSTSQFNQNQNFNNRRENFNYRGRGNFRGNNNNNNTFNNNRNRNGENRYSRWDGGGGVGAGAGAGGEASERGGFKRAPYRGGQNRGGGGVGNNRNYNNNFRSTENQPDMSADSNWNNNSSTAQSQPVPAPVAPINSSTNPVSSSRDDEMWD